MCPGFSELETRDLLVGVASGMALAADPGSASRGVAANGLGIARCRGASQKLREPCWQPFEAHSIIRAVFRAAHARGGI